MDNVIVSCTNNSNKNNNLPSDEAFPVHLEEETKTAEEILEDLHLTSTERLSLEEETIGQSSCWHWFEAHCFCITGSKCGRILSQKEKTVSLLCFFLYQKPFIHLPKPITWGKEYELKARRKYVEHMRSNGHIGLTTSDSGFVVHSEKCWLGASPDAWVTDPSVQDIKGIAEFKCPYREAKMSLVEACQGSEFCCVMVNDKLHMKESHVYYHQVQLQLYVTSDYCS